MKLPLLWNLVCISTAVLWSLPPRKCWHLTIGMMFYRIHLHWCSVQLVSCLLYEVILTPSTTCIFKFLQTHKSTRLYLDKKKRHLHSFFFFYDFRFLWMAVYRSNWCDSYKHLHLRKLVAWRSKLVTSSRIFNCAIVYYFVLPRRVRIRNIQSVRKNLFTVEKKTHCICGLEIL